MKNSLTYKICICALLTAFALIAFILESLLPPLLIPGARLGLSNAFILLTFILLGAPYGFSALIVKCTLGSVFSGNISAIIYSLPSGVFALGVQALLMYFCKRVSVVCVSTVGGVVNLVCQNLTFCLVTGTIEFIVYLPYLALIGVLSGLVVGFAVFLTVKFLPRSIYDKLLSFSGGKTLENQKG